MTIGAQTLEIMRRADWYNRWLFSWVKSHLGENILEIGSGIGNFTPLLLGGGRKVIATDVRQEYLQKLKSQIKSDNLRVTYGDIEKNEFGADPGRVDTIVCLNVLEHIKEDGEALRNMLSKLERGGKLILLVPAGEMLFGSLDKELGHFRRYSKKEIKGKLEDSGFAVQEIRYLNWLGALGWFLNARILRRRLVPSNQVSLFDKFARPFLILEKKIEFPFGLSLLAIATKK